MTDCEHGATTVMAKLDGDEVWGARPHPRPGRPSGESRPLAARSTIDVAAPVRGTPEQLYAHLFFGLRS